VTEEVKLPDVCGYRPRVYETSEFLLLVVLLPPSPLSTPTTPLLHPQHLPPNKMRYTAAIAATMAASAAAFPGMNKEAMMEDLMKNAKRSATPTTTAKASATGLLGGVASVLGTVTGDLEGVIQGLVGSVASAVDADDFRPQPGYVFQAPGPNDS